MAEANIPEGAAHEAPREIQWAAWMRASLMGDMAAYRMLLEALAPVLRRAAKNGLARAGAGNADAEDVVQEILLAIHLKRQTWMSGEPFTPWLNAIARHKLIDVLRRRGRRSEVPIENLIEILPDESETSETSPAELSRLVDRLDGKSHAVVRAVSLDGASVRDTATKLGMSEGAVRDALHRGLKKHAMLHREAEA